jgi:hypothetical protein
MPKNLNVCKTSFKMFVFYYNCNVSDVIVDIIFNTCRTKEIINKGLKAIFVLSTTPASALSLINESYNGKINL